MAERQPWQVLVVGAGPAGLAAATTAAERGATTLMVAVEEGVGGQIWRHRKGSAPPAALRWQSRAQAAGVRFQTNTEVVEGGADPEGGFRLRGFNGDALRSFRTQTVILATGSRELFLPFPGWTLPGVLGAGGLQSFAKAGLEVRGKRIVVAGSGPLLLAVAADLRQRGGEVVALVEQASRFARIPLLWGMVRVLGSKAPQGVKLLRALRGVPRFHGSWPEAAHGIEKLEAVTLRRGGQRWTLPCDFLACGWGLVPEIRLAQLLGCRTETVDSHLPAAVPIQETQQTSVAGVFAAGEVTGIGGVELALLEGEIAGLAAAAESQKCRPESLPAPLLRRRARHRAFAEALRRSFDLRPELRSLARPETPLCRCEGVAVGEVLPWEHPRHAKLQTRCGMGACQGRVCGPALTFLKGWQEGTPRPPLTPIPLGAWGTPSDPSPPNHSDITQGSLNHV